MSYMARYLKVLEFKKNIMQIIIQCKNEEEKKSSRS
jgi:hypothetical protein